MNVLTIDAATGTEIVAVDASGFVSDKTAPTSASHSVTLFNNIDAALREAGITEKDLDLLGVGAGPGSFTGLRIAVATARMLAQVLEIPLVPLDSPLIYAASLTSMEGDIILSAFDAKKGRVFGALYRKTSGHLELETIVPPGDYPIDALLEGYDGKGKLLVAGYGIEKYSGKIHAASPDCDIPAEVRPSGAVACALARRAFEKNPGAYHNYDEVTPRYARKSDAEVMLELRKKPT